MWKTEEEEAQNLPQQDGTIVEIAITFEEAMKFGDTAAEFDKLMKMEDIVVNIDGMPIMFNTDPPRILEPGNLGSKVGQLAHVQGYRGPQG